MHKSTRITLVKILLYYETDNNRKGKKRLFYGTMNKKA